MSANLRYRMVHVIKQQEVSLYKSFRMKFGFPATQMVVHYTTQRHLVGMAHWVNNASIYCIFNCLFCSESCLLVFIGEFKSSVFNSRNNSDPDIKPIKTHSRVSNDDSDIRGFFAFRRLSSAGSIWRKARLLNRRNNKAVSLGISGLCPWQQNADSVTLKAFMGECDTVT